MCNERQPNDLDNSDVFKQIEDNLLSDIFDMKDDENDLLDLNNNELLNYDDDDNLLLENNNDSVKSVSLLKSDSSKHNSVTASWDDYEIQDILGEGSYGKIFKVKEK